MKVDACRPILFEIDVGNIDRESCIPFMSQYPGEGEVFIPPRSFSKMVNVLFVERACV